MAVHIFLLNTPYASGNAGLRVRSRLNNYLYLSMYFIHININIHIHINVHINVHINIHINVHINIYINIHINIYTTFREIKPLYQCLIKQSLRKPTILMINFINMVGFNYSVSLLSHRKFVSSLCVVCLACLCNRCTEIGLIY